jgi:hypothetical protein
MLSLPCDGLPCENVVNCDAGARRFIEQTSLTVLLWVGLWGAIQLVVETLLVSFIEKLFAYTMCTVTSIVLLRIRRHI